MLRSGRAALLVAALLCLPSPARSSDQAADAGDDSIDFHWYESSFWETIDGRPVEDSWEFSEDEVRLHSPRGGRGSLLSPAMPEHFDLCFQWMIGPGANNGLKYRVRWFDDRWLGIEYQMIEERIPLAKPHIGSTASIYDLVAPTLDKPLNPAGQWNQARIVAHGSRLEHYLNGRLVASARTDSADWQAAIARSKFYGFSGFGQPRAGDRIMLTDHGGQATYRDFQLTVLSPPEELTQAAEMAPQLGNGMRNSWADRLRSCCGLDHGAIRNALSDGLEFVSISRDQQRELSATRDADLLLRVQLPGGPSSIRCAGLSGCGR